MNAEKVFKTAEERSREIADSLGFLPHGEAIRADWVLRCVRESNRSDATGRIEPEARRNEDRDLFGGEA